MSTKHTPGPGPWHTPGPWRRSSLQQWYVIPGDEAEPICSLAEFTEDGETEHVFPYNDTKTAEANACLMAAAPDLLEALQGLTLLIRNVNTLYHSKTSEWLTDAPTFAKAEAAIARAKGE